MVTVCKPTVPSAASDKCQKPLVSPTEPKGNVSVHVIHGPGAVWGSVSFVEWLQFCGCHLHFPWPCRLLPLLAGAVLPRWPPSSHQFSVWLPGEEVPFSPGVRKALLSSHSPARAHPVGGSVRKGGCTWKDSRTGRDHPLCLQVLLL